MAFPTSLTSATNGVTDVDASHLNALEAKVGIDSSAVTTSHDYKLSGVTGSDKAASKAGSETLTNKTLTSPVINVGSDATGDIYYRSSGAFTRLAIGSASQVLTVSSGIPSWATPGVASDGWTSAGETWTYSSATAITVPSNATTKYNKGDKIRLKQGGGYKYFYVVGVTATTLTVTGGDDYSVANASITDNYFSKAENPLDFPHWFLFTSSWTGFSSAPAQELVFFIRGTTCFISLNVNGTSNSATFDFTLPVAAAARNAASINITGVGVTDNSTDQTVAGIIGLAVGGVASATAKVGKTFATRGANAYAGFTTSGTKGAEGQFHFEF